MMTRLDFRKYPYKVSFNWSKHKVMDVRKIKKWLKNNSHNDYCFTNDKLFFLRFKDKNDAVLCKLTWG